MTDDQYRLLREVIDQAITRLAAHTGFSLPAIHIDDSLRGRCAGQARLLSNRLELRVNCDLLHRYQDDYLAETVPHEVAHLHLLWCHRSRRRKPRPHGPEWQALMRDCFGLEPKRCHSYQTRPARKVPRNHLYRCPCREHRLTSIMHNRIQRVGGAMCRNCRTPLAYQGKRPFPQ